MNRLRIAIYDPALHLRGGGEKYAVALAEALAGAHEIHLFGREPLDLGDLAGFFGGNLDGCSYHVLPPPDLAGKLALRLHLPHPLVWALRDRQYYQWFRRQGFDHFFTVCHDGLMPCPAPRGTYSVMFPTRLEGWRALDNPVTRALARAGFPSGVASLRTHDTWASISAYTLGWTRRYWGEHPSHVLYPQCDDLAEDGVPKRKVILHVGRFFDLTERDQHHHKRQDALIEAFARLTDLHADGWELHLAGAVADSPRHRGALDELRTLADGAPVVIHPNLPFPELKRLHNEATLYWHATGFGTDPETAPSAQEHFGISVVEAMSAGAVPLVYGTAGPAETVRDRVDGRHWRTLDELVTATREVLADPAVTRRLADSARERARAFGKDAFAAGVRELDLAPRPTRARGVKEELGQLSWFVREQFAPDVLRKRWRSWRGTRLPRLPRRPVVPGSVWAVTMVRDEADIITAVLDHLFAQGVDHVIVADNGSADATPRLLAEYAAADPRLHLAYDAEPAYFQAEKMSLLVHAAWRAGADWIVPFDADEFWFAEGRTVKEYLTDLGGRLPEVGMARARWYHMVPTVPNPMNLRDATFVLDSTPVRPGKVAVRSHRFATVSVGNHGAQRVGALVDGLHIAHAIFRGPGQVARKVRQGTEAVLLTNPGDDIAVTWRVGSRLGDDVVAEVWDNISAGRPDARLNYRALGPMVRVHPLTWESWDPDGEVPRDIEPAERL